MEQPLITAVTHSPGEARVTLIGVPDTPASRAGSPPRSPMRT